MMDCLLTEEETVLGGAVISEKELSEERSSLFIPCDSRAKREGGSGDEVLSSLHGSPRNVLSVLVTAVRTAKIPHLLSQGSKVVIKAFSAHHRLSNTYLPVANASLNAFAGFAACQSAGVSIGWKWDVFSILLLWDAKVKGHRAGTGYAPHKLRLLFCPRILYL